MDAAPQQDLDALEAQNFLPESLEDCLVCSEPRYDAYNSRWLGIAIGLLAACTLIAAALIAHAEAAL